MSDAAAKVNLLKQLLDTLVKMLKALQSKLADLLKASWKYVAKAGTAVWKAIIKAIKWPWEQAQALFAKMNPFKKREPKTESVAVAADPVVAAAMPAVA